VPDSSKGLKNKQKISTKGRGEDIQLPPAMYKPDAVLGFAFFMAKNLNADVVGGLLRTIAKFFDTI